MTVEELAAWLIGRGWEVEVIDAVTIDAAKLKGGRLTTRIYHRQETLLGFRWVIAPAKVPSRRSTKESN